MFDEPMTTAELLEQWRDTVRAAELAERLAGIAKASVERSERDARAAADIATMAERAARHAERAARLAREAADRAATFAREDRDGALAAADLAAGASRTEENDARDRYHEAERQVRERHEEDVSA